MAPQGNTSTQDTPFEARFVILRHECGPANGGDAASHWDLMLELPGHEKLITWQVETPPENWRSLAKLPAKRIDDHRKIYLTYEGEISNGRGHVKRVSEGTAHILASGSPWRIRLCGEDLTAEFEIHEAPQK